MTTQMNGEQACRSGTVVAVAYPVVGGTVPWCDRAVGVLWYAVPVSITGKSGGVKPILVNSYEKATDRLLTTAAHDNGTDY